MATLVMGRLKLTTLKDVELIHGEKHFEPCCLQPIRARNSCTYPCKSKDHHGHEMGGKYNQKAHSRVLRVVAKRLNPVFSHLSHGNVRGNCRLESLSSCTYT